MARQLGQQGPPTVFRTSDLKICELCGWLNLASNPECFVCGWHGRFEHDTEVVQAAVELAVQRLGRLELQYLTDPTKYHEPAPASLGTRIRSWFTSLVERLHR